MMKLVKLPSGMTFDLDTLIAVSHDAEHVRIWLKGNSVDWWERFKSKGAAKAYAEELIELWKEYKNEKAD